MTLLDSLPNDVKVSLRRLGGLAEDVDWPAGTARREGWREANQAYQAQQRKLGAAEMRALLDALHLAPPLSGPLVEEVLVAAIELYLHTEETDALARLEDGQIRIDVSRCPIFDRFMDARWFGITACGCFARRRGWYETLGVHPEEELVMTRKWGDPVCELVIRLPAPVVSPA